MLSRTAESIYWMSRYIERAENVARFISVNLNLNLDMPDDRGEQWWPLVVTTGDDQVLSDAILATTLETMWSSSSRSTKKIPTRLLSCLIRARENARSVREAFRQKCGSMSTNSICLFPTLAACHPS